MSGVAPLVSVVIPTYNRAHLVTKAIDSVLAQTYASYEIIVVDDGSSDDTAQAVRRYGSKVKYFYQPNRGAAAARNVGFRESQGVYIAFLDSDDRMVPGRLSRQVDVLERYPEAVLCFGDVMFSGQVHGRCLEWTPRMAFDAAGEAEFVRPPLERFARGEIRVPCMSVLARREAIMRVGGMCEEFRVAEDLDLWLRLRLLGSFVGVKDVVTESVALADGLLGGRAAEPAVQLRAFVRSCAAELTARGELQKGTRDFIRSYVLHVVVGQAASGQRVRALRTLAAHVRYLDAWSALKASARCILPSRAYAAARAALTWGRCAAKQ